VSESHGMEPKICVVAGVGPGNGTAFTRKFAGAGYRVAMLARTAERLAALVAHQDRSAWTFELDLRPFGEKL